MSKDSTKSDEFKSMFDRKRKFILISSIFLTIIYWILALWYTNKSKYTKDLVVFYKLFGSIINYNPMLDFWQYIYQFWITMVLFFLVPLIIVKYYFKEDLRDYGLRAGNKKLGITLLIPFSILLFFATIFISQQSFMISEYPLTKLISIGWSLLIFYEFNYFFYFFAYEVMMRGYLQWGLKKENTSFKGILSILIIQTTISTLFHIGKPLEEILTALIFGFILGYFALKLNSIWYGMILHFILNFFTDFFILFWLGMLPTHI